MNEVLIVALVLCAFIVAVVVSARVGYKRGVSDATRGLHRLLGAGYLHWAHPPEPESLDVRFQAPVNEHDDYRGPYL